MMKKRRPISNKNVINQERIGWWSSNLEKIMPERNAMSVGLFSVSNSLFVLSECHISMKLNWHTIFVIWRALLKKFSRSEVEGQGHSENALLWQKHTCRRCGAEAHLFFSGFYTNGKSNRSPCAATWWMDLKYLLRQNTRLQRTACR